MSERPALPSVARRVTLFEDRAEVVRTGSVSLEAGSSWVALSGVSPFVDERSVQVRVGRDDVRVLGARVVWSAHAERALGREAIEGLEHAAREARVRSLDAQQAIERADAEQRRFAQAMTEWALAVARVPRKVREERQRAAWHEAIELLEASQRRALADADAARRVQIAAEDERVRAETRLQEGSREAPRYEARVEVQLTSAARCEAAPLEITYRVGGAAWRPEHLARLTLEPNGSRGSLEIVTYATIWQCTGERWEDVRAQFSTARPARGADPPRIEDDVLAARRKADWERGRVVVEARDQEVVVAGLGRGARAVDEMPGVDDGGEPRLYVNQNPVTIPSDARPTRVEVARTLLPADVVRVFFAERTQAAHVRATATLTKGGPLLAGPVRVARGASLVGRGRLAFVGTGEPFELGFGVDDGLRARRTVREERDTTSIIGTQRVRRTVTVHVSNLSDQARTALLTERIPVSEISDVTIALTEHTGWSLDGPAGLLRQTVDLAPGGVRSVSLAYEIRASAKVVLPF